MHRSDERDWWPGLFGWLFSVHSWIRVRSLVLRLPVLNTFSIPVFCFSQPYRDQIKQALNLCAGIRAVNVARSSHVICTVHVDASTQQTVRLGGIGHCNELV